VFVLPSRHKGLSNSLLEAMASGLPAVVSDVGDARDVIRHGDNGFLYPPGDIVEFSQRLSELLDDEGLSHELGQRAARDAQAHAGRAWRARRTPGLPRCEVEPRSDWFTKVVIGGETLVDRLALRSQAGRARNSSSATTRFGSSVTKFGSRGFRKGETFSAGTKLAAIAWL
jgi:hypothetical protein